MYSAKNPADKKKQKIIIRGKTQCWGKNVKKGGGGIRKGNENQTWTKCISELTGTHSQKSSNLHLFFYSLSLSSHHPLRTAVAPIYFLIEALVYSITFHHYHQHHRHYYNHTIRDNGVRQGRERERERERVGEPSLHQLSEPPCSNIVMLMFCCLVNSFITNAAHIQQSFHPPSPLQPLCPPIIMTRPGTEKQSWLVHLHPFQIPPSWRNMNIEYVSQESRQSGRPHLRSAPLYTQ